MKNLLIKLLQAQKKIEPITKSEENPYYKSSYFDINAVIADIKPIFSEVGLVVLQPQTELNGKPALQTIIADPESGEMMERTTPLIESSDPQKFGATLTYQRRYALTSFLCLQGEDDDGNVAAGKTKAKAPAQQQTDDQPFYDSEPVDASKQPQDGDLCSKCQKGHMKKKNGKFGEFLGCDAYPDCKHIVK